jgi:hypothetical protein
MQSLIIAPDQNIRLPIGWCLYFSHRPARGPALAWFPKRGAGAFYSSRDFCRKRLEQPFILLKNLQDLRICHVLM